MSFIIHTGLRARVGAPRQGRCPWEEGRLLGQPGGPASSRPFVEARGSLGPLMLPSGVSDCRPDTGSGCVCGAGPCESESWGRGSSTWGAAWNLSGGLNCGERPLQETGWGDLGPHAMGNSSNLGSPARGSTVASAATEHTSSAALHILAGR